MEDSTTTGLRFFFNCLIGYAIGITVVLTMMAIPLLARGAETPDFSATFNWKTQSKDTQPMRIRVSNEKAQINAGGKKLAQCRIRELERDETEPHLPIALHMDCKNPKLDQLTSRATILWNRDTTQKPVLRFGTWLNGYEQASLDVEVDRFAQLARLSLERRH